jgi:hypothetical protein
MDKFIVIVPVSEEQPPYKDCQVVPEGSEVDQNHKVVHGPETEEECKQWLTDNCVPAGSQDNKNVGEVTLGDSDTGGAANGNAVIGANGGVTGSGGNGGDGGPEDVNLEGASVGNIENIEHVQIAPRSFYDYLPHIVTGYIIVIVSIGIGAILYKSKPDSLLGGDAGVARGLITFLVAVVTIAIALILTLSAVSNNSNDFKERFALGKEVLTVLIGVLGTIIGFYFGSAPTSSAAPIAATQSAAASVKALTSSAKDLETEGFQALLAKDYNGAASAFDQAYRTWSEYHNVDEINKLLKDEKDKFDQANDAGKEAVWNEIYCALDTKYYWKMPDDFRAQFHKRLTSANVNCNGTTAQ